MFWVYSFFPDPLIAKCLHIFYLDVLHPDESPSAPNEADQITGAPVDNSTKAEIHVPYQEQKRDSIAWKHVNNEQIIELNHHNILLDVHGQCIFYITSSPHGYFTLFVTPNKPRI